MYYILRLLNNPKCCDLVAIHSCTQVGGTYEQSRLYHYKESVCRVLHHFLVILIQGVQLTNYISYFCLTWLRVYVVKVNHRATLPQSHREPRTQNRASGAYRALKPRVLEVYSLKPYKAQSPRGLEPQNYLTKIQRYTVN